MSQPPFNRKEASKITGIPSRRILFYVEQSNLLKRLKRPGRGFRREYDLIDIAELILIRELGSLGVTLAKISDIVFSASRPKRQLVG